MYFALEVEPFPTKQQVQPGLSVDYGASSIMGVPVGQLAVVKTGRPTFMPWGIGLLCFGIGLQLGVGVFEFIDAKSAKVP